MFHGFCMHLEITADVFISCLEALWLSFMNVNSISKSGVLLKYKQFLYSQLYVIWRIVRGSFLKKARIKGFWKE